MMLSLEPMDIMFSKLYLFDKTKPLFGHGDLAPIFKVTSKFSIKICLEYMDGFYLILDILLKQAKGIRSL